MHLLASIRDNLGMIIIIATHDMDIVPLYCDDTYLLSDGGMYYSAHLMEIWKKKDGLDTNCLISTIGAARQKIKHMIQENNR